MHEGSTRAIAAAFFANAGIATAKFVGFAFTGASSMLAEAFHSVADTGNQALLFFGGKRAARPATATHPFGYGRERYFWSFIVAVVLFLLGGLFALYEGIEKLRHPHEIDSPIWAFAILGVAIVLESFSLRTAVIESAKVKGQVGWGTFIRRAKSPELPVVLLEDIGALLGLVFAMLGVTLAVVTGNGVWDGAGTVAIGALLVVIAVVLAVEMKSLLMGEGAGPAAETAIRDAIESQAGHRLIHMRTQHIGPEELLVGAKVEFPASLDAAGIAAAVDGVEARIRDRVPIARIVYIEPAIYVEGGTRPSDPPPVSPAH